MTDRLWVVIPEGAHPAEGSFELSMDDAMAEARSTPWREVRVYKLVEVTVFKRRSNADAGQSG